MSVAPARVVAFSVLRRVFEQGAFADRALHTEAAGLGTRDRALAMRLVYGTVQRKRTLDHLLSGFVSRPLEELEPPVLEALRLGLFQILFLGGVTDYAAVNARLRPPFFADLPHEFQELSPSYRAGNPEGVAAWLEGPGSPPIVRSLANERASRAIGGERRRRSRRSA